MSILPSVCQIYNCIHLIIYTHLVKCASVCVHFLLFHIRKRVCVPAAVVGQCCNIYAAPYVNHTCVCVCAHHHCLACYAPNNRQQLSYIILNVCVALVFIVILHKFLLFVIYRSINLHCISLISLLFTVNFTLYLHQCVLVFACHEIFIRSYFCCLFIASVLISPLPFMGLLLMFAKKCLRYFRRCGCV